MKVYQYVDFSQYYNDYEEFGERWDNFKRGVKNAGKVALLGAGMIPSLIHPTSAYAWSPSSITATTDAFKHYPELVIDAIKNSSDIPAEKLDAVNDVSDLAQVLNDRYKAQLKSYENAIPIDTAKNMTANELGKRLIKEDPQLKYDFDKRRPYMEDANYKYIDYITGNDDDTLRDLEDTNDIRYKEVDQDPEIRGMIRHLKKRTGDDLGLEDSFQKQVQQRMYKKGTKKVMDMLRAANPNMSDESIRDLEDVKTYPYYPVFKN